MRAADLYSTQTRNHVEALINGMRAIERHPSAFEQLDACMRAARSLKVAARVAGVHASAELAQAMENCFITARLHEVALRPEQIVLMFRGVDLIERMAGLQQPESCLRSSRVHLVGEDGKSAPAGKSDTSRQCSDAPSRKNKRVLVVDDSPEVREIERRLLSVGGYDVETAVDGVDAWKAVGVRHFDLVLTDIDMPLLDGIELTKLIRADARFGSLPVVVACEETGSTDRWRAFDAGANYYVLKDSFDWKLVQTVASLIGPAQ